MGRLGYCLPGVLAALVLALAPAAQAHSGHHRAVHHGHHQARHAGRHAHPSHHRRLAHHGTAGRHKVGALHRHESSRVT